MNETKPKDGHWQMTYLIQWWMKHYFSKKFMCFYVHGYDHLWVCYTYAGTQRAQKIKVDLS